MFAILVQRAAYFVSGESSILVPKDEKAVKFALQTAQYMKTAGEKDFMHGETGFLNRNGRRLLRLSEKEENDEFYLSCANFFRMFLLILRQAEMKDHDIVDDRWKVPLSQRLKDRILYRLRPDTFEMRFALRMNVVLMTGMAFNFLFPEGHSYWLVMNAFLLLRPMYEDSNYRMKTRFLGTVAGCFRSQLKYNLEMLFHMHHMYLRILEDSLTNPLDYWRLCDAQLQYHMVHAQIRADLPRAAKGEEEGYLEILAITWRMASEIQQMFFHIKHKKRSQESRQIIQRYIYYADYVLNQIQEMMHLKKEKHLKSVEGMQYQRYIEGEPKFSELMTLYAHNLSRLYARVLKKYQNPRSGNS